MLRVGYVGQVQAWSVGELVAECLRLDLGLLVVCGGLADGVVLSLARGGDLGRELGRVGILFRYVVDTCDVWYPGEVGVVDREVKVRSLLARHGLSPYLLDNHPIIRRGLRVVSGHTHYDYSYYRGQPLPLAKLLRKRWWGRRHGDGFYWSDAGDAGQGLANLFDVRYTVECNRQLQARLAQHNRSYGVGIRSVVCTNMVPHARLLGSGVGSGYWGTFTGNAAFSDLLGAAGVSECYYGREGQWVRVQIDGVGYQSCVAGRKSLGIVVVDYD